MAKIVGVHGIAQQVKGPEVLKQVWLPALRDGLRLAGGRRPADEDLACAFYGDLFRKPGTRAGGVPPLDASDIRDEWEVALLTQWWKEAAGRDSNVDAPEAKTRARTPQIVQRALHSLSKSRFFAGLAERALIWSLKQVGAYLNDNAVRRQVQQRIAETIGPDTRVVIGHSLGTVVAYEAQCAHPEWHVETFVTLGSPLGIPNLIFDKLEPPPVKGLGIWPGVRRWFNIADAGDVVALEKTLASRFGDRVTDILVHNDAKAHDIVPYLTAKETGAAIASGLD